MNHQKKIALPLGLVAMLALIALLGCAPEGHPSKDKPDVSIKVVVMDSVNGSIISNCSVVVTDSGSNSGTYQTTDSVVIPLVSSKGPFVISATPAGYACSRFERLDPRSQNTVTLYAHKPAQSTRPTSAVSIASIGTATAADGTGFAAFNGGTIDVAATPYLVVAAVAESGIEATSWNGFGIKIDIDNMPTVFNGLEPASYLEQSVPVSGGFRSKAIFDLSGFAMSGGQHRLDIVAYDVVNNRAETALSLSPGSSATGVDISSCVFSGLAADLRVYGKTRDYFAAPGVSTDAMTSFDGLSTSYRGTVSFSFADASSNPQAILGFDVERSADGGATWTKLATVNYGAPSTGPAGDGTHTYYEVDPGLEQGVVYSYRVTAFTDATHRLASGIASAIIMDPFTTSLLGPASKSAQTFDPASAAAPDLTFSISNTSLWDSAKSDYFYFSLLVRDRSGAPQYFGRYRYSFISDSFQFKAGNSFYRFESIFGASAGYGYSFSDNNADYMSYSNGVITIKGLCLYLDGANAYTGSPFDPRKGQDYEWDIFGDYSSGALGSSTGMIPAYFQKAGDGGGIARSYADVPADGNHTMNGWFEFSVQ